MREPLSQPINGSDSYEEPTVYSAQWLAEQKFDAPLWVVDDLIPVGLTLLASDPKAGKSFWGLQTCFNAALGTEAFWKYPTKPVEAMYMDLELPQQDSQARFFKYMAAHKVGVPQGMRFRWESLPFGSGGFRQLENTLEESPGLKLIVIDVIAKMWPSIIARGNSYHAEYALLSKLKGLADKYRAAIVCLHHNNKMQEATNPLHQISGTQAMSGVPDCVMVLTRKSGQQQSNMFITGRKVRERNVKMRFDSMLAAWYVDDDPIMKGETSEANQDSDRDEPEDRRPVQSDSESSGETHKTNGRSAGSILYRESYGEVERPLPSSEESEPQGGLFNAGEYSDGGEGGTGGDLGQRGADLH